MTGDWRPAARACALGAVLVAPVLAHLALATGRHAGAAVAVSSLQAAIIATLLARRWLPGLAWIGVGVAIALAALGAVAARAGIALDSAVTHTLLYTTLLVVFARSLRPGRRALLTTLAIRLGGPRSPEMTAYTRSVTIAWVVFFLGQLLLSGLLLAAAPLRVWSLFVNILDLPLVCLMFGCEYAVRLYRFRDFAHVSIPAVIRAFSGHDPAGFARHVR